MLPRPNGRALPHHEQEDADYDTPLLGEGLKEPDLGTYYEQNITKMVQVVSHEDRTRRDYRRRLIRVSNWWETHYPEYFALGVREVGAVEGNQPHKYFYGHTYKRDLVYSGLNVKFFLAFLCANERKANGQMKSFVDIRKYKDAVVWASSVGDEKLPMSFYRQIEIYLVALRKKIETSNIKKMRILPELDNNLPLKCSQQDKVLRGVSRNVITPNIAQQKKKNQQLNLLIRKGRARPTAAKYKKRQQEYHQDLQIYLPASRVTDGLLGTEEIEDPPWFLNNDPFSQITQPFPPPAAATPCNLGPHCIYCSASTDDRPVCCVQTSRRWKEPTSLEESEAGWPSAPKWPFKNLNTRQQSPPRH